MLEPEDFRDVLAVARAGSLKGAAQHLGVDPSTMGRRVEAVEARLGAPLFVRGPSGFSVTPEGAHAVTTAERLEEVHLAFEREVLARSSSHPHSLTLTVAEWGIPVLTPLLAEVAEQVKVPIWLRVDNRALDLSRREADLALRVGAPTEPALVGKRVGVAEYGLYGAKSYLRRHAAPKSPADCAEHTFVSLDASFARAPHVRFQATLAQPARVALQTNSMLSLVEAARAGLGLATLPCVLARLHPELRRLLPAHAAIERDMWLVFHRDLRRSQSVRRLVDALLAKLRPLFVRSSAGSTKGS